MYDLTPILRFAVTNAELTKRLREKDYGNVADHLKALNNYKMLAPEVLQEEQQVHMGLLFAQLLDAANNPARIQSVKEMVNSKWVKPQPVWSKDGNEGSRSSNYTKGTIFNIIVGCSRDPLYKGNLLDNPRCAGMFRDDVIERVHHKTMPIYMDRFGNIKIYFEGSTDTCNIIFKEDAYLPIPLASLEYLYSRHGIEKAIISTNSVDSQSGQNNGFEMSEVINLKDLIQTDKHNTNTWLLVGLFIVVVVCIVAFYLSYASQAVTYPEYSPQLRKGNAGSASREGSQFIPV